MVPELVEGQTAEKADRIRRLGRMTGRLFEIGVSSANGLPLSSL